MVGVVVCNYCIGNVVFYVYCFLGIGGWFGCFFDGVILRVLCCCFLGFGGR